MLEKFNYKIQTQQIVTTAKESLFKRYKKLLLTFVPSFCQRSALCIVHDAITTGLGYDIC